jgi:hypothetical protein
MNFPLCAAAPNLLVSPWFYVPVHQNKFCQGCYISYFIQSITDRHGLYPILKTPIHAIHHCVSFPSKSIAVPKHGVRSTRLFHQPLSSLISLHALHIAIRRAKRQQYRPFLEYPSELLSIISPAPKASRTAPVYLSMCSQA